MMDVQRLGICLAAILTVTMAANKDIPNVEVMYEHSVNLTCDPEFQPAAGDMIMWLLPNGDLVKKDDNHERVQVFENAKHIRVIKVDDVDFGVYNCITYVFQTQNYKIVQLGLNMNGPYWGDLLEKYRMNLIVGGVAGAIVLVLMLGICYIMNRGHSLDEDEKRRVKVNDLWVSNKDGVDNAAVELDDVEVHGKKAPAINGDSPPPVYTTESTNLATKL